MKKVAAVFALVSLVNHAAQAGPVTDACRGLVSYLRSNPVPSAAGAKVELKSEFLSRDPRVQRQLEEIAAGTRVYTLSLPEKNPQLMDLAVKLVSALRYVGMEPAGYTDGVRVDQRALEMIDAAVVRAEAMVSTAAAKMPYYSEISGGDLRSNLPQKFAAYMYVTFFELVEAGHAGYQNLSKDCLMATLYPKNCAVFAGTFAEMTNRCEKLKPPFTVQTPGLFGFFTLQSRADMRVPTDELVQLPSFPSTLTIMAGMVHESGHEFDSTWSGDSQTMHRYYPRKACGKFMDSGKKGSPFKDSTGVDSDYVSGYASGAFVPGHEYRQYETFAESLTAFLLYPEYFRALAAKSPKLQAQYDYLKTRVIGAEFTNPSLADKTSFAWLKEVTAGFSRDNAVECFVPGEIVAR